MMESSRPAFVVRNDKIEEFIAIKRDTTAMMARFERLKQCELSMGKSETHPDIVFLNRKMEEFKNELENR